MKFHIKFIVSTLAFLCYAKQSLGQHTTDKETLAVLSFLIRDNGNLFLLPKLETDVFASIRSGLSRDTYIGRFTINNVPYVDTLRLTEGEKDSIQQSLHAVQHFHWTQKKMRKYGLSNFKLVDTCQPTPKDNSGTAVYQIMKPIFLRNHTISLVYYEYKCGGLCGHGELSILIKKDGKWDYWDDIFVIVD